MLDLLKAAGFVDAKIQIKERAEDIISKWMPGSGAEKYVTSAYVTATKPTSAQGFRDDPRGEADALRLLEQSCCPPKKEESCCPPPAPAPEPKKEPEKKGGG